MMPTTSERERKREREPESGDRAQRAPPVEAARATSGAPDPFGESAPSPSVCRASLTTYYFTPDPLTPAKSTMAHSIPQPGVAAA
jgi:hypothetical protein